MFVPTQWYRHTLMFTLMLQLIRLVGLALPRLDLCAVREALVCLEVSPSMRRSEDKGSTLFWRAECHTVCGCETQTKEWRARQNNLHNLGSLIPPHCCASCPTSRATRTAWSCWRSSGVQRKRRQRRSRHSYCQLPPVKVIHNSHADVVKQSELADKAMTRAEADEQTAAEEMFRKREEDVENWRSALRLARKNIEAGQGFRTVAFIRGHSSSHTQPMVKPLDSLWPSKKALKSRPLSWRPKLWRAPMECRTRKSTRPAANARRQFASVLSTSTSRMKPRNLAGRSPTRRGSCAGKLWTTPKSECN